MVVRFLADTSQYNLAMTAAESRLLRFARQAEGYADLIKAPFYMAGQALMAFTDAVVKSGISAVQAAMHYEELGIQLKVLAGDADKGEKLLQDMFQTAVTTPFHVKDVVAAGKQLRAFGFDVEDIVPTLKALGDISAGTGTPMYRLILAFGQTRIAGRLMGQEMRQFVNSNVPLVEHLASVMKKPVAQIKKMIENGQVGFNMVQEAMNEMTGAGGNFAGMMDKMNKTTKGQWIAFTETLEISLAKIGGAFLEGFNLRGLFTEWRHWANNLSADTGPLVETFRNLRETFRSIYNWTMFVVEVFRSLFRVIGMGVNWIGNLISENEKLVKSIVMIFLATTSFRIAVWAAVTAIRIFTVAVITLRGILVTGLGITALISLFSGLRGVLIFFKELGLVIWGTMLATAATYRAVRILVGAYRILRATMLGLMAVFGIVTGFQMLAGGILAITSGLTAFIGFAAPIISMAGGIGLMVIGFTALYSVLKQISSYLDSSGIFGGWLSTFKVIGSHMSRLADDLIRVFSSAWKGIKDAVDAGDFRLAMEVAFTALGTAWELMVNGMLRVWHELRSEVRGTVLRLQQDLAEFWVNFRADVGLMHEEVAKIKMMAIKAEYDQLRAESAAFKGLALSRLDKSDAAANKKLEDVVEKARIRNEEKDLADWQREFRAVNREMEAMTKTFEKVRNNYREQISDINEILFEYKRDHILPFQAKLEALPEGLFKQFATQQYEKVVGDFKKREDVDLKRVKELQDRIRDLEKDFAVQLSSKTQELGGVHKEFQLLQDFTKEYEKGQEIRKKEIESIHSSMDFLKTWDPVGMPETALAVPEEVRDLVQKSKLKFDPTKTHKENIKRFSDFLTAREAEVKKEIQLFSKEFYDRRHEAVQTIESMGRDMILQGRDLVFDLLSGSMFDPGRPLNVQRVQYSIGPQAKSIAEKYAQKHLRGVGDETHKYDFFMKDLGFIEEARTGLTPELQKLLKSQPEDSISGRLGKNALKMLGEKNRAMDDEQADYAILSEYDILRKWVGDQRVMGPQAMMMGTSEAQDTINRSQQQQTSVMDQVRITLLTANEMQKQQLQYQKETVAAIKELTTTTPATTAASAVGGAAAIAGFTGAP